MTFEDSARDAESLVRELLRDVGDVPATFWNNVMGMIADPLTPLANPTLVPDLLTGWGDDGFDLFGWDADDDDGDSPDDSGDDDPLDDDTAPDDDGEFDDF